MGWMLVMDVLMDVWDECVRGMHAMNACMRWMCDVCDGCNVWDGCMGWMHGNEWDGCV